MTDKQAQLQKIHQELENLAASGKLPLARSASDIVPGEGNCDAEIMFIGEAPGYHESVQRRPFVGKSGQFLRKTFSEVGLQDKDVYISNIVKVRPPDNRDPLPKEIWAFKKYLDQEIEVINPILMVTLGRFSMAKFLPDVKISQVHGRLHKVRWLGGDSAATPAASGGRTLFVLPMYHPAAGLRNGNVRASFVADFQKITKILKWIKKQAKQIKFESDVMEALL